MRKIAYLIFGLFVTFSLAVIMYNNFSNSESDIAELRKQHETFLKNSPFKETLKLSKEERKALGIPPNKYFEREWELTIDPATGRPHPERVFKLQEELAEQAKFSKVPGENTNNWVERGPNDVGGRTRAVMFDPNDATNKRVFAGGVSGGLWVNNDITDVNSSWAEVDIPQNLAITCITYDPNNTNIFYVGTGESYVQGDVNGNGVWQSTNGGSTWSRIFGGRTGDSYFVEGPKLTVNTPASIAGDYAIALPAFGPALTSISGNLVLVDDGSAAPNEGCSALTNSAVINGNIAVVIRGNCNFTDKVLNAQNAGAIAVVVVDNVEGALVSMSGDEPSINIPSVFISKSDGDAIIAQLSGGVNISLQGSSNSVLLGRYVTPGIQHVNDIKIRNNNGVSEVYVAAAPSFYSDSSPFGILGAEEYGLYRSINEGVSWSKVTLPDTGGSSEYIPNDIEVSADNTIWLSTTNLVGTTSAGSGTILSSLNGTAFRVKKEILNGERTELALSATNPNKIYALAELSSASTEVVTIISTTDGFTTDTTLNVPNDAQGEVFTRSQAFYDLVIEVDPNNDAIVYIGGIDLHRSSDSGVSWTQISDFYGGGSPTVHPDQHALVFDPTDSNKAIVGNDGGVYYARSFTDAVSGSLLQKLRAIEGRNKNYNTLQFYHAGIGQETVSEKFLAGAQDNGGLLINNANAGLNGSIEATNGGDGAYMFVDKDNEYLVSSTQNGRFEYRNYTTGDFVYFISGTEGGQFITPAALNSSENYLFSDGSNLNEINRYQLGATSATSDVISNVGLSGSCTAFKVSPFSSTTLLVGTDNGKLFRVTNSTSPFPGFTDITSNNFIGSISSIAFGATQNDIIVTFHNYGVISVYYSSNAGASWQSKEGNLPDLPVKAVMVNPLNPDEVILGTELGVWGTANFNDANPSWSQAQNGMKDVKVTSFDLRTSDNTVLASTYGRGMFTGQFTADDSSLSIEDNTLNSLVKVYPTVSNGNFKISSNSQIRKGTLNIFDLNGREVYQSKINFNNGSQNVSINVSSGMYIVKFTSEGKQSTQKIIIK